MKSSIQREEENCDGEFQKPFCLTFRSRGTTGIRFDGVCTERVFSWLTKMHRTEYVYFELMLDRTMRVGFVQLCTCKSFCFSTAKWLGKCKKLLSALFNWSEISIRLRICFLKRHLTYGKNDRILCNFDFV